MAQLGERSQRMDELLQSTPIEVAGKLIQPVARLEGWHQHTGTAGEGMLVRLSPALIQVREGDRHYSVPITDPTQTTLRTLFWLGGTVSLVCLSIMLLTVLLTRR
jgi:hypothetical protein